MPLVLQAERYTTLGANRRAVLSYIAHFAPGLDINWLRRQKQRTIMEYYREIENLSEHGKKSIIQL